MQQVASRTEKEANSFQMCKCWCDAHSRSQLSLTLSTWFPFHWALSCQSCIAVYYHPVSTSVTGLLLFSLHVIVSISVYHSRGVCVCVRVCLVLWIIFIISVSFISLSSPWCLPFDSIFEHLFHMFKPVIIFQTFWLFPSPCDVAMRDCFSWTRNYTS